MKLLKRNSKTSPHSITLASNMTTMDKRTFLKIAAKITTTAPFLPWLSACATSASSSSAGNQRPIVFELAPLPYPTDALEPHIDKLTMEIHHGKHHAAYINNLNKAKANTPFDTLSLEDILTNITANDNPAIRNNAGGHYNHQLFWTFLSPQGGGEPTGKLADAINGQFGSFANFKENFSNAAKGVFGSGWAWLVQQSNKLIITTTPNQDNPLMKNLVSQTGNPLLGIDVWEHAYYLNYQNRRADYIEAFFKVLNWEAVAQRMV